MPDTTPGRGPVQRTEERQARYSRPLQELAGSAATRTVSATNNPLAAALPASGTCSAECSDAHHDPRLAKLIGQAQAACDRAMELQRRAKEVRADTEATRQLVAAARRRRAKLANRRDLLRKSEFLRLAARVQTMPVIEQAKGIVMYQSRCGEDQAFDLLRRASQRSNIPVRELAAQIVSTAGRAERH